MSWKVTTMASLPVLQAQNEFSGSCLLVRVWDCRRDLKKNRRANTQGNDDMTTSTGCCKSSQSLFLFFPCPSLVLLAEIRRGYCLGFLLDLNMHCFGMVMSSLFLLLSWMSLCWMFSTTIDLQWDMDLESELTKSNWEKILSYQKCTFSVACSFLTFPLVKF